MRSPMSEGVGEVDEDHLGPAMDATADRPEVAKVAALDMF